MQALTLTCPIRGLLKTGAKSKDGLKPSEEYFRVEAIKHLIKLGYHKDHIKVEAVVKKFGNSGRNSMRADLAVLDVPVGQIPSGDVDALLEHAVLLCEVKRENSKANYVANTQVKPLLDFAKNQKCIALYWDSVEQRVFWYEYNDEKKTLKEGALVLLPRFGRNISVKPLTFNDIRPTDELTDLFERIEDLLHAASIDLDQRFSVMLQMLLAKLFDEHGHQSKPLVDMDIQDYKALGHTPAHALSLFNSVLAKAVGYYQNHLPRPVDKKLHAKVTGDTLLEICKTLAPIKLIASRRDVVQTFYMKFAKGLYKWDLAQFFTPPTVTDFVVDVLNPQFGEHIKDPACGSADFLTAAFHKRRDVDPAFASCIWGADNSKNAVQVAVLNMLLNGDGKSNIEEKDSLEHAHQEEGRYDILVCNPPFGVRIVEKRPTVLKKFDLGHEWEKKDDRYIKKNKLLEAQETGLLFAEVCVVQAKSEGGRIGIILPNGYLANRSHKYQVFRDWLLRHTKLVAICAFPRFVFKTSGADVSASVLYLEKRAIPLKSPQEDPDYSFTVQMIENVGWNLGDKKAAPLYIRNPEDGSYVVDIDGHRKLDADFSKILEDIRRSDAAHENSWLADGLSVKSGVPGWSINISEVLADPDLTIDPKRYTKKFKDLQANIKKKKHHLLGDLVDFIPEKKTSKGAIVKKSPKSTYNYIEIAEIGHGDYKTTSYRGWELPDRAKHFAEVEDIYIGSIWSSVSKWCIIARDAKDTVVTNGCHRLRIKEEKRDFLVDLVAFMCSEAYTVQMRAYARGSDGLAEVPEVDVKKLLVPELKPAERNELTPFVESLLSGAPDLHGKVIKMISEGKASVPFVPKRSSHVILV